MKRLRGDVTKMVYGYEKIRAISSGILETAGGTFLLFIAVRYYDAGAWEKGWVAASNSIGLMLTPWVVNRVQRKRWRATEAAAALALLGAAAFGVASVLRSLPFFVVSSLVGIGVASSMIPLLTHLYHESYPEAIRGRLYTRVVVIRVVVSILFSFVMGHLLAVRLDGFPLLLLLYATAFLLSSFCLSRCPSTSLGALEGSHLFRSLRYVRSDRLFRHTLVSWMLMGFANLMMLPMRVDYLANEKYGLHFDAVTIAFLTGVLPNMARLLVSPMWGWLFDRMDFFALRVMLNAGFIMGIFSFFTGESFPGLVLGAILFGVSTAGGDVAWGLWVTKIAPADRVADYMSIHTCLTGVRGLIAPLVGFHLVGIVSLPGLAWISMGMILVASAMLIPDALRGKGLRCRSIDRETEHSLPE